VDLTGVSPLVGLTTRDFITGQAALKADSNKVAKYKKACSNNQMFLYYLRLTLLDF
jgi:hypothetical protein